MFEIEDVVKVSEFLATKEGKNFFNNAKKVSINVGLSNENRNAFALMDTFNYVIKEKVYSSIGNWTESDFEWNRIARTTDSHKIGYYLVEVIDNMGYTVEEF